MPPLTEYLEALYRAWGPQRWWPADSAFEIVLGAFLTQNTAWTNVEQAMANLRGAGTLSVKGIRDVPLEDLEQLVRPAGYFRQKAARLKTFVAYLDSEYQGSLVKMFNRPTSELRPELLALNGIGPETADSILLYAGQHEVFVVDAYSRRIFERHALVSPDATYEEIRQKVESDFRKDAGSLDNPRLRRAGRSPRIQSPDAIEPGPGPAIERPESTIPPVHAPSKMSAAARSSLARRYNEFHGLIVQVGKHHCLKRAPVCEGCPLERFLPPEGAKELPSPRHEKAAKRTGRGAKPG